MSKPKKRKKSKGRIVIKQNIAIVRKDSIANDSIRKDKIPIMKPQPPRSNGAVLKVKVKKR